MKALQCQKCGSTYYSSASPDMLTNPECICGGTVREVTEVMPGSNPMDVDQVYEGMRTDEH